MSFLTSSLLKSLAIYVHMFILLNTSMSGIYWGKSQSQGVMSVERTFFHKKNKKDSCSYINGIWVVLPAQQLPGERWGQGSARRHRNMSSWVPFGKGTQGL